MSEKSQIECKTRGLVKLGAMCRYIKVGGKYCSVSIGKCPNQEQVQGEK